MYIGIQNPLQHSRGMQIVMPFKFIRISFQKQSKCELTYIKWSLRDRV
jgi:hypothetical protein